MRFASVISSTDSHAPVRLCCRIQSLRINAADQPLPLRGGEHGHGCLCGGPDKVTFMQTALTQPHAGAILDLQLHPVLPPVAKGVGRAVTR